MIKPSSRERPGVTLIEILVVIFIIGVLLALLLPAVQTGQESARRTICQNNLKNITLGTLGFANQYQNLPALYNGGFLPAPRSAIDEFHFHPWRTPILPYLEQSATFASINLNLPATVAENQTAINVSILVYTCPDARNPNQTVLDIARWNDGQFPVANIGTAARSDYEAVGGVQIAPQTKISSDLGIIRFGVWGEPTYNTANGVSIRYRKAQLADITDGLSNTILIGERAGRPDLYVKGKPDNPYPYLDKNTATDPQQAAWGISTHFWWLVNGRGQPVNQTNSTGIFSFHPGGANIALADGSVRFLKETTAPAILKGLITRSGSEVAQPD